MLSKAESSTATPYRQSSTMPKSSNEESTNEWAQAELIDDQATLRAC